VWADDQPIAILPPAKVMRIAAMTGITDSARIFRLKSDPIQGEKVEIKALRYRIWVFGRNTDQDSLYDLYSKDGSKWIMDSPNHKGHVIPGNSDFILVKQMLDRIAKEPIDFAEDGKIAISSSHRCILIERITHNEYQWAIREFTGIEESGYLDCCKAIEVLVDLIKSNGK
jgi:hypothetical protein